MEACHATHRRFRPPPLLSRSRVSGGEGYPSETRVGRGDRVVHGDKELIEKLGRNDLCPCGSGRCFQEVLPHREAVSSIETITNGKAVGSGRERSEDEIDRNHDALPTGGTARTRVDPAGRISDLSPAPA